MAWWASRRVFVRIPLFVLMAYVGLLTGRLTGIPPALAKHSPPQRAERLNPLPNPSGAEAAYPLNHTFVADIHAAGTPPANSDFEAAGVPTGNPPANVDLQAASTDAGVPTNYNF